MATILIVDDRPINREFLATLLDYAGHRVEEASNGVEALVRIGRGVPDLVIADVLMPVLDGVELAKQIRANPATSHVPIVFYTATHRVEEARELAATCGVRAVIAKPSEPQVLLDVIHRELGLPTPDVAARLRGSSAARPVAVPPALQLCKEFDEELARIQVAANERPANGGVETVEIEHAFARAQALSMRLAAVIELGTNMGSQTEPLGVIEMFCHGARDVLNARLAVACLLDEGGAISEFVTSGLTLEQGLTLRAGLDPTGGLFGNMLRDGTARRRHGPLDIASISLPSGHVRIDNFLAAPIVTNERSYGWFYVADRLGMRQFALGDEQVASTLAAQFAAEYRNRVLLDRVQRHSAVLQVEIAERKETLERLGESELRFRQLTENIREVFFLTDADSGAVLYISPAYEEIWQRPVEHIYANAAAWLDDVHPDDRPTALENFQRDLAEFTFEYRIVRPDGGIRWIKARGFPIRDATGTVYRTAGIAEDITEAKLQELSIRRLSRIHRVLSGINSAIVRIHERDALLDEACRIAVDAGGFPIAWISLLDSETQRMRAVASRGIAAEVFAALNDYLATEQSDAWSPAEEARQSTRPLIVNLSTNSTPAMGPVARVALDRGYRSLISLPLLIEGQLSGRLLLYSREADVFDAQELALLSELAGDVSFALQYIAKEEQLDYLAYYDPLTGLPNAALFREQLSQVIRRQPRSSAALFLLDLDRLRHINESFGRHVGDRLLASFGKRLEVLAGDVGAAARIGEDTFAVVVPTLRVDTDAGLILQERLFATLGKPFVIDGEELRVSVRAGVAMHPSDGANAETLLRNAEAALKEAKASSVRYLFYSPKLNAEVAEELALEQQLHAALERREFVVYYQPKVAAKSGELVGVEALLRWRNRKGALVPPDRFIRLLEETELILDVGRWVLEQALVDYKSWREKGLRPLRIAVNVSPVQLRYPDFPEMVIDVVEKSGIDGSALELEITESVIMGDMGTNIERLQRISDRGVTIAIDDFGTGYSSLRYLAKLPVDTLKIDRSFVMSMATDPDGMTLVSTIVGLAHAFELGVVAEGVESEDQAHLLRLMKCDMLQGYLFGKPMPASEIEKLLQQQDDA